MVFAQDFEDMLLKTGREFFVSEIRYVSNILAWSKERRNDLSEPSQPMKVLAEGKDLVLFVQSEIPEAMLENVVRGLSVRWAVKDNAADPSKRLNSVKKRLAYCLLKECAKSVKGLEEDELFEDEWAIQKLEQLGFFLE